MRLPAAAQENLRFLVAEVLSQCLNLRRALSRDDTAMIQRIVDRAGYTENLKNRVQSRCIEAISLREDIDDRYRQQLSDVADIAHQLERITDKFRDACRHYLEVDEPDVLRGDQFKISLTRIRETLDGLEQQIPRTDNRSAMALADCANRIDKHAAKLHGRYVSQLAQRGTRAADLSRGILMAHSLKQVGDAILRISEDLLSIQLGQPMNLDRYQSLEAIRGAHPDLEDAEFSTMAETRSGSAVAGLRRPSDDRPAAVFKDGLKRKLRNERKGVESWHSVFPGLAPRILAYQKRGESAALLIEHLPGLTFEKILTSGEDRLLDAATQSLCKTLRDVWGATRAKDPVTANFMAQLQERLPDIRSAHPRLVDDGCRLGSYRQPGFEQLVRKVAKVERRLPPAFSVYIHGDFNVDNVIYDPDSGRIHFIDLHRSRYMDYVQDVSVFMVSCFRLPRRDDAFQERVMGAILGMNGAAKQFARRQGDSHYDYRLALGLARSLASSTRFIADTSIAASLMTRSRYLMERIIEVEPAKADQFKLPLKEIFRARHFI